MNEQSIYQSIGTAELRKLVISRDLASGTPVAFARKANLIALLEGRIDTLPSRDDGIRDELAEEIAPKHDGISGDSLARTLSEERSIRNWTTRELFRSSNSIQGAMRRCSL